MPIQKLTSTRKVVVAAKAGKQPRVTTASTVRVPKGKTSAATKEAVKSNAERHREAMIRLANR